MLAGALSVQDLMCDGCRGVAVGGDPGRMLGGAYRGGRLVAGLQRGFVFRWGWLFMGRWFARSANGGGGLWVMVGGVGVWGVCALLFWC